MFQTYKYVARHGYSKEPQQVTEATENYKMNNDTFLQFTNERIVKDDSEETKEAVGDKSYTSKGGTVTQTATGLTHQAGSGVYGGTETDSEEEARKKADDEAAKKEVGEAVEEIDEAIEHSLMTGSIIEIDNDCFITIR